MKGSSGGANEEETTSCSARELSRRALFCFVSFSDF